jgi:hypothetical protein
MKMICIDASCKDNYGAGANLTLHNEYEIEMRDNREIVHLMCDSGEIIGANKKRFAKLDEYKKMLIKERYGKNK